MLIMMAASRSTRSFGRSALVSALALSNCLVEAVPVTQQAETTALQSYTYQGWYVGSGIP